VVPPKRKLLKRYRACIRGGLARGNNLRVFRVEQAKQSVAEAACDLREFCILALCNHCNSGSSRTHQSGALEFACRLGGTMDKIDIGVKQARHTKYGRKQSPLHRHKAFRRVYRRRVIQSPRALYPTPQDKIACRRAPADIRGEIPCARSPFSGEMPFFDFKGDSTASMMPATARCYSYHAARGATDTSFVQFYPTLLPIAKSKATLSAAYLRESESAPPTTK
jgi:hypothetical protein